MQHPRVFERQVNADHRRTKYSTRIPRHTHRMGHLHTPQASPSSLVVTVFKSLLLYGSCNATQKLYQYWTKKPIA